MPTNRQAVKFTDSKSAEFRNPTFGFNWDSDDSKTPNWRPQGISGITNNAGDEYIFVSWYDKANGQKGARISVIERKSLRYRNVLLVQQIGTSYKDYGNIHAGGIAVIGTHLHVADSRSDQQKIRVFDLEEITYVKDSEKINDYRYLLVEKYAYNCPINPSYLSYDRNKDQILVGEFHESPEDNNKIAWISYPSTVEELNKTNIENASVSIYLLPNNYKKIQGIVASEMESKKMLWLSTSYGSGNRSNFYSLELPSTLLVAPDKIIPTFSDSEKYPPGLEDLYLSQYGDLWALTEFYFNENAYLPLENYYNQYNITNHRSGESQTTSQEKVPTRRGVFIIRNNIN